MTLAHLVLCVALAAPAPPPTPPDAPPSDPVDASADEPTEPAPKDAPVPDDAGAPPTPGTEPAAPETTDEAARDEAGAPPTEPAEPPAPAPTPAPTTPSPGLGDTPLEDEPVADDFVEEEPFEDEPYDPLRDSPEALQSRHLVRTGIALLVVGGTLTATAIVFGAVDPCTKGFGNSCQQAAARRAALAIGIPGAIMIAGGATSLALGIVRRNQLRASFAVSRDGAMLGVSGRF